MSATDVAAYPRAAKSLSASARRRSRPVGAMVREYSLTRTRQNRLWRPDEVALSDVLAAPHTALLGLLDADPNLFFDTARIHLVAWNRCVARCGHGTGLDRPHHVAGCR